MVPPPRSLSLQEVRYLCSIKRLQAGWLFVMNIKGCLRIWSR
jgi:hypothetical protein